MKFISEYRDAKTARDYANAIARITTQPWTLTEIKIITEDTKLVDRGKGDGIFINTTGVGAIERERIIAPNSVEPGNLILLKGDLGRYGIASPSLYRW